MNFSKIKRKRVRVYISPTGSPEDIVSTTCHNDHFTIKQTIARFSNNTRALWGVYPYAFAEWFCRADFIDIICEQQTLESLKKGRGLQ